MHTLIKRGYRLTFYRPLKFLETLLRRCVFTLLPRPVNGFALFKLPTGRVTLTETQVIAPTLVTRTPPLSFTTPLHARFEDLCGEGNGASYALIRGGYATSGAAHLTASGALISNYTQCFSDGFAHGHPLQRFRLSRMRCPLTKVKGRVASLIVECQNNYYHWLFDALHKIEILQRAGVSSSLYYTATQQVFQRDTLSLLGIPPEHCLPAHTHPFIQADELLVTSFPVCGIMPRWVVDFLRTRFRETIVERSPKRLFISRSDAKARRILNEEELAPLLKKEGFTTIIPGHYSFAEQVALFKEAEVIIAPHGAGLSNLAFCAPKAKVLEILAPGMPCVCFWALSHLVGLDYHCLRADPAPGLVHEDSGYNDMILNPASLASAMKAL